MTRLLLVGIAALAWGSRAGAQPMSAPPPTTSSIYSCIDAKGRRITSDRPNMECLDREQKRYGATGTAKGTLPPSLTAEERMVEEEKARVEEERRLREIELKRRDRVLLNRYPNAEGHQRERDEALSRVDSATQTGEQRVAELIKQREQLALDEKAAGKDNIKLARVRRAIDDNEQNLAAQKRLLAAQADERLRINKRFDEELARLKPLWAQNAAAQAARAAASRPKP